MKASGTDPTLTAVLLGAQPTGYYNRFLDNSVNIWVLQNGNQVNSKDVSISNIQLRQLTSEGVFNAAATNNYNANHMSYDEDLWFTFEAESIA